jgi:deferrochelatase/peroxidase EfeB
MRGPRRQFVPLQRRLAEHDAPHAFLRHIGSAVFAIPPGAAPNSFIAQPLF